MRVSNTRLGMGVIGQQVLFGGCALTRLHRVKRVLIQLHRWGLILFVCGLLCTDLSARPRKLEAHKRSPIATKRVDAAKVERQEHSGFKGKRIDFKKWHKQYASTGKRKALQEVDRIDPAADIIDIEFFDQDKAPISEPADKLTLAKVGNWNRVRDVVVAAKYSEVDITSPAGRHIQELVDAVSLAQINRFQVVSNEPEEQEGIPVQRAAQPEQEAEAVSVELED